MTFLSNAHTHTTYCDGKNTAREMLEAARQRHFLSLGFSGHADQGFDFGYSMSGGRQESYLGELRALQAELREKREQPRLWVGLEQDALVPLARKQRNREQFDYILGSTHYLSADFHGQSVAVDGDVGVLMAYVEEVYAGDMLAMAQAYFDVHVSMLRTDRPDVIGHFDLVRRYATTFHIFDTESVAYQKMALAALESAYASGGVLEVNTGGMARGYISEPFPSKELLLAWREMGGAVTLTSDCHDATLLDYGFEEVLSQLKEWGYKAVLRLGTGEALWEALEC